MFVIIMSRGYVEYQPIPGNRCGREGMRNGDKESLSYFCGPSGRHKFKLPFTCILDSKKLKRQLETCFILFVEPNDPFNQMFQFQATSNTSQQFCVDLKYKGLSTKKGS